MAPQWPNLLLYTLKKMGDPIFFSLKVSTETILYFYDKFNLQLNFLNLYLINSDSKVRNNYSLPTLLYNMKWVMSTKSSKYKYRYIRSFNNLFSICCHNSASLTFYKLSSFTNLAKQTTILPKAQLCSLFMFFKNSLVIGIKISKNSS